MEEGDKARVKNLIAGVQDDQIMKAVEHHTRNLPLIIKTMLSY